MEEVQKEHSNLDLENDADKTLNNNSHSSNKIKFIPGLRVRSNTTHQKGIFTFTRARIDSSKPLILVVACKKKWEIVKPQNFAVVVTLEHSAEIDLYNKLHDLNTIVPSIQLRVSQRL